MTEEEFEKILEMHKNDEDLAITEDHIIQVTHEHGLDDPNIVELCLNAATFGYVAGTNNEMKNIVKQAQTSEDIIDYVLREYFNFDSGEIAKFKECLMNECLKRQNKN